MSFSKNKRNSAIYPFDFQAAKTNHDDRKTDSCRNVPEFWIFGGKTENILIKTMTPELVLAITRH